MAGGYVDTYLPVKADCNGQNGVVIVNYYDDGSGGDAALIMDNALGLTDGVATTHIFVNLVWIAVPA